MSTATAPEDTRIYRGRTVEELIPKIQAELGVDAIVVRQREGLTGGIGGFFQRSFVELEAKSGGQRVDLYDERDPVTPTPVAAPEPTIRRPGVGSYVNDQLAALVAAGSREPATATAMTTATATAEPPTIEPDFQELAPPTVPFAAQRVPPVTDFAAELRAAETAAVHVHSGSDDEPAQPIQAAHPAAPPADATLKHARARASIEARLLGLGVSGEFASELIDSAIAHVLALAPGIGLVRAVQRALEQRIPTRPPLSAQGAAVALIGAGGSGKTGCCAALLNAYRVADELPASCATIARGAGAELELLLSPYVMEPAPVSGARATCALASARQAGLLLLDTPTVSRADRAGVRQLAGLLRELAPERVVIALPATLGATPAAQLLEALRPLRATSLAITHSDETDQLGVAVELACRFDLAPEYLLRRGGSASAVTRVDPACLAEKLLR
jgi:flagellar biosynthesis GTPase FlhF